MQHILTPQGSKNIDRVCMGDLAITGGELMQHAARSAVEIVDRHFPDRVTMLLACGSGNNGGDGFAMAHMMSDIHDIIVVTDADPSKMSMECRDNYEKARATVRFVTYEDVASIDEDEIDVVIDAIIGVGGSADLRHPVPQQLRMLNALEAFKIAIDVPTGLDALTGAAHDDVFRPHLTITMEGPKAGFFLGRGRDLVRSYEIATIGAPFEVTHREAAAHILEDKDIHLWLPERRANSNKYDYGRVLVVGGTQGMRGAVSLAGEAALRVGAGLSIVAAPSIHPLTPREVITELLPAHDDGTISGDAATLILRQLERATVLALGPGLGTNEKTLNMLAAVVNAMDPAIPVVIDADGLRIVPMLQRDMSTVVLTPHEGEYRRLVDRLGLLETKPIDLASKLGCVLHRKGVPSISTDGKTTVWTVAGDPGMATAGTGDVLTGIVGGLLAQGLTPLRAAALGAFIHARAGELAVQHSSQQWMVAGDLIRAMADVL